MGAGRRGAAAGGPAPTRACLRWWQDEVSYQVSVAGQRRVLHLLRKRSAGRRPGAGPVLPRAPGTVSLCAPSSSPQDLHRPALPRVHLRRPRRPGHRLPLHAGKPGPPRGVRRGGTGCVMAGAKGGELRWALPRRTTATTTATWRTSPSPSSRSAPAPGSGKGGR